MKTVAQFISALALVAILLAAALFFTDRLTLATTQTWLLGATLAWFVATPLWMGRKAGK